MVDEWVNTNGGRASSLIGNILQKPITSLSLSLVLSHSRIIEKEVSLMVAADGDSPQQSVPPRNAQNGHHQVKLGFTDSIALF